MRLGDGAGGRPVRRLLFFNLGHLPPRLQHRISAGCRTFTRGGRGLGIKCRAVLPIAHDHELMCSPFRGGRSNQ